MDIKIRECQIQSGGKHGKKRAKYKEFMNITGKTMDVFERLPMEILHDIILRLPVTSLARLRFTSKLWYARVMDPNLADSQLSHAMENPGYFCASFNQNSYFLEEMSSEIKATRVCRKPFLECFSSGGLIAYAVYSEGPFYICNPLIGEEVKVPACPPIDLEYKNALFGKYGQKPETWGFGYSLSTKEYKIVMPDAICPMGRHKLFLRFAIYTLGSYSWRDISSHASFKPFGRPAECKGTIFWLQHDLMAILAFDVGSEKFHSLPVPNRCAGGRFWTFPVLLNVGETIAFVSRSVPEYTIWKLRDKDNGTWMNEYIVNSGYTGMALVSVWKKKYLFAPPYHALQLVYYDDESKQFREIKSSVLKDSEKYNNLLHVVPHAGGLISPLGIVANAMKKNSISKSLIISN